MTIDFQVLGEPGRDNAVLVRIDSGQAIHRLLFDCGEGCLADVKVSEVQSIDHLMFSHFHMDHVSGFDRFFRCNFNRPGREVQAWGPPETSEILGHRFRGFVWNLYEDQPGEWWVHDIGAEEIVRHEFFAREAFARAHRSASVPFGDGTVVDDDAYRVTALHLDHRTPSMAYVVREKPRQNIGPARLAELGIAPGPWLKPIKEPASDESPEARKIEIDGEEHDLEELREQLLVESEGDSVAYLTDFLLDDRAEKRLVAFLEGVQILICESQYRAGDIALARQNYHTTVEQAARLAHRIEPRELVLFHLSDRYSEEEWSDMLAEAQAIFPATRFPERWGMPGS